MKAFETGVPLFALGRELIFSFLPSSISLKPRLNIQGDFTVWEKLLDSRDNEVLSNISNPDKK
ncbi:hypothetical protein ACDZ29_22880 [Peribacillus sp. RS7]